MRSKPIQRDEIRFDGYRITTLPLDSVELDQSGWPRPIEQLWKPLLSQLDKVARLVWDPALKKHVHKPVAYPKPFLLHGTFTCLQCGREFWREDAFVDRSSVLFRPLHPPTPRWPDDSEAVTSARRCSDGSQVHPVRQADEGDAIDQADLLGSLQGRCWPRC